MQSTGLWKMVNRNVDVRERSLFDLVTRHKTPVTARLARKQKHAPNTQTRPHRPPRVATDSERQTAPPAPATPRTSCHMPYLPCRPPSHVPRPTHIYSTVVERPHCHTRARSSSSSLVNQTAVRHRSARPTAAGLLPDLDDCSRPGGVWRRRRRRRQRARFALLITRRRRFLGGLHLRHYRRRHRHRRHRRCRRLGRRQRRYRGPHRRSALLSPLLARGPRLLGRARLLQRLQRLPYRHRHCGGRRRALAPLVVVQSRQRLAHGALVPQVAKRAQGAPRRLHARASTQQAHLAVQDAGWGRLGLSVPGMDRRSIG